MAQHTPGLESLHGKLGPQQSRYVDVEGLPWQATRWPGIETKTLFIDPDTGVQTVLTRMAPGTVLTDHMHVEIEQTWVLEGSLVDHEGEAKAGSFVWRPKGSRHTASAPNGALLIGFFLKPNTFF
ncbi:MAG: cupin domain-containing protein [Burkholderiales bacterium]|nr:cupin domain-containing protein [Burkholderiales bacterium]